MEILSYVMLCRLDADASSLLNSKTLTTRCGGFWDLGEDSKFGKFCFRGFTQTESNWSCSSQFLWCRILCLVALWITQKSGLPCNGRKDLCISPANYFIFGRLPGAHGSVARDVPGKLHLTSLISFVSFLPLVYAFHCSFVKNFIHGFIYLLICEFIHLFICCISNYCSWSYAFTVSVISVIICVVRKSSIFPQCIQVIPLCFLLIGLLYWFSYLFWTICSRPCFLPSIHPSITLLVPLRLQADTTIPNNTTGRMTPPLTLGTREREL